MLTQSDIDLVGCIVDSGSVRVASDTLGRHPATVYRQIRTLQTRLGEPLFQKANGTYSPTLLALTIARAAEDNRSRLVLLNRQVSGAAQRLAGNLTVTTTDSLCEIVGSGIAAFTLAYPDIRINLVLSNSFADLARYEADVAIRPTQNLTGDLVGRRAARFDYSVYKMPGAPDRWIAFGASLAKIPSARWLAQQIASDDGVASVESMLAAATLCKAGVGKAVLPTYLDAGLLAISGPIKELASDIWVLAHDDLRSTPRVSAFTSAISRHLRDHVTGRQDPRE
jgi:DNA-binding transcriptional LysR family regulator